MGGAEPQLGVVSQAGELHDLPEVGRWDEGLRGPSSSSFLSRSSGGPGLGGEVVTWDLAQGLGFGRSLLRAERQMVAWIPLAGWILRGGSRVRQAVLRSLGHCGRHRLDLREEDRVNI